jgi:hypothetical protein
MIAFRGSPNQSQPWRLTPEQIDRYTLHDLLSAVAVRVARACVTECDQVTLSAHDAALLVSSDVAVLDNTAVAPDAQMSRGHGRD